MTNETFYALLEEEFAYPFTPSQARAALLLTHFVLTPLERPACILRGYAGTGKTSLVGALVRLLNRLGRAVVLLAPTGRAAKVFSAHADFPAGTIHRAIYREERFQGESTHYGLGYHAGGDVVFIVDEASMIATGGGSQGISPFGSGELLDDLVDYVYSVPGCRLLMVGDNAQLPPVGEEESAALKAEVLERYGLTVGRADLLEVVRQESESNVLSGATLLRKLLAEGFVGLPPIRTSRNGEVRKIRGNDLIEQLTDDYRDFGTDGVTVITRSNKQANLYNNGIRARIFDREEILCRGDRVMVVKNNYHWIDKLTAALPREERPPMTFLANGETAEIVRLSNVHEQYGFLFAEATLRFSDYEDFELDCRVLLSTLRSESPSLTAEERERLFQSVLEDYMHIPSQRERMKALRADAYYNAVQLKYAYAVTCHKAQGGQWPRVYIDQGFIPEDVSGASYLRWLYTAFTRTTERLYLVNWPDGREDDD